MKKILALVCAAMMIATAEAKVLFNEHFDRTLGTLSSSTWSGGELPNDSNWHTYSPGTVQFQVVSQQLKKTDYCSASSGKAVQYTANHSRDYLLFPQAFNGANGDKVYMAFLLKVSELQTTSSASSATNANNSIMSFAINASNNALGSLNGRVIIKTEDESSYKLGISRRGETPQFAEQVLSKDATYLIVAEYCFIEGEKNDVVNLYIDPTPAVQTIAITSVNPSTASADTDKLVGMALCSNGNTPVDMLIDELRAVTSWDDLWEDSSAPTPSIDVASSLAFGDVTKGEAAERTLKIQGANLQGAISVSSDKEVLVPAVSSISAADAAEGYSLSLTLTATQEGAGSANLTLSSPGASDQIVVVSWNAKKPVPPVGSELLENGSFEEYSCNAVFGCSFDSWNIPLNTATANSTDKLDGEVAMQVKPNVNSVLDQGVMLTDAEYAAGTLFKLTLHYKVVALPESANLDLDCYWEPSGSGDAEAMKQHEADILQRTIATEVSSEWKELVLTTSKPAKSAYFRVRVKVPKGAKVLFDKFSLTYTPSTDPYIEVSPKTLPQFSLNLGETATKTVHIRQGNLSGKTTFYIGGKDKDQFSLSATELPADQSDLDLIITYAPTSAGTHSASLIFDNAAHTTILPDMISLSGTCSDPSAKPVLTVTPSTLPDFEVLEGKQQKMTVTLSSINCTDYVYAHVDHISPAEHGAFTIYPAMFSKNSEAEVTITFSPLQAGTYQSTITFYSEGADNVVLTLNGTGIAKTPETIDWQTDFVWNDANPLSWMYEPFDDIQHNETFVKEGWQNVAAVDQRPWQGVDASTMQSIEGDGKFVRATAYQYGKDSTATWETWLVTPALDYKKAESKIFAFSVMGMYLPDDGNSTTKLEVYYMDATGETLYTEDWTGFISIPTTSDDNEDWKTFYVNLEQQIYIADVFHVGFHFVGPNGNQGSVTYYIDDVSWGRTDLPTISVTPSYIAETATLNTKKTIGTLEISGKNLTEGITLSLGGDNYDHFSLSTTSLPAEGGSVEVYFEGEQEGVHVAYVSLSSKDAADVYVAFEILCKRAEGIEEVQRDKVQSTKVLREGRILILRDGKSFNLLGIRVE